MKRKRLALLLAAAMTVTSLDSTAMFVSGADFSSEVEEEVATQAEEGENVADEVSADDTSADVEFSDEAIDAEVPDESEVEAEVTDEEPSQDTDVQVEEDTDEPDFSADVQEDVAADAGDDMQENATALELDKDYTVDLKVIDEDVWFKFTPGESGRYNFYSTSERFEHPAVYFYDPGYSMEEYWSYACDNNGNDFALTSLYLEEGVTYYYRVRLQELEDGADGIPFTVRLEKKPEVESVSIDLSKVKKEFIAGMDYFSANGAQVTVNYEGSSTPTVLTFNNDIYSNYVSDSKGNSFYYILTKDGEEDDYDYEELLTAGTYEVSFRYLDRDYEEHEIDKITVTAKKPDASMFDALKLGENTVEVQPYEEMHWYYFEAEETGYYRFLTEVVDKDEYDIDQVWQKIDEDGNLSYEGPEWSSFGGGSRMEKGDKYLVGTYTYFNDGPFHARVTISKSTQVTSVTAITDDMRTEFTEYIEPVDADGLKAKVTYEDGTSQTIAYEDKDTYDRYLTGYLVDENGESVSTYHTKAGKYIFKVLFGDKDITDIPVTVVSVDSKVTAEISDGASELTNNGKVLLKYTASEDGRYQFDFNAPVNQIEIYKVDGKYADNVSCEERRAFADLEKGATYYVYAQPDDLCKKLTVNVTLTTRPVSLEAKSLRKTAYIAGIDSFDANDIETTVSFGNTTRTVRGTDLLEGYDLRYKVMQGEDTDGYGWDEEPLIEGTWTVTPYLASGTAIDVAASSTTVTAKMFDANEMKAFPAVEENKWTSVENTRGDRTFYTFTPKESGLYTYSWGSEEESYSLEVYRAGRDQYRRVNPNYATQNVLLEAGQTYLLLVSTYGNAKFKIDRLDPGAKPETLKELALTDGMEKNVEIDKSVDYLTCTFTPKENGAYRLDVSAYDGNYFESYVELSQGGKEIYSSSLAATIDLSAGKEYVYKVSIYDSNYDPTTEPFTLKFNKVQKKTIQSIDLVLKNGKKASDLSIFDNFGDFYQLKFTYTDGKTWTKDFELHYNGYDYVTDPYDNGVEITVDITGFYTDATMKANVYLYIERTASENSKLFKKEITCKAVGSLPAIEAGKDYKVPKSSTLYKFIPKEDGEYICTRSDRGGISYVSVFRTNTSHLYSSVVSVNEGEEGYSMKLEKGKIYYINAGTYQSMGTDATFRIQKLNKTINGLKVVTPPTKKTLLPNNKMYENELVSLSGLKVEVSYTDGTKETITYGQPSQEGRYIRQSEVVWMANGKAKVYVALGRYTASFELEADSWDNVPEVKLGESKTLDAQPEDSVTLKFVPKETGVYYIYTTNSSVSGYIRGTSSENKTDYIDGCNLKAGETYYFTVIAISGKPVVTIKTACKNDKHSFGAWKTVKAATCVATGLRSHTCTNCGKEETEVIPATGKHTMSSWKVTVASTVTVMGTKERKCTVCGKKETARIAKLKPTITLSVGVNKTIPLKVKQSLPVKAYGFAKGDRVVSWTTSSAKIATVSKTGTVVGKAAGTATITVKLLSGLKASFKVKVQKTEVATTALKVVNKATGKTLKSATLKLKKSLTLVTTVTPSTSKQKVTYTSSNKKVATVSAKGVVTAKKAGTTTITVKSGKKSVKITIKVTK